ncbi:MAG: hypothetical protein NTU53_13375 [Planctomycetota bacterium]|nr:hypothetical protein [Planctomycetota bacterium]
MPRREQEQRHDLGLTSAQRACFRVAAVAVTGQGPWSDPATKIVP